MNDRVLDAPDDWTVATLGDVATLVKDKVDPTQLPEIPYIGLEHIEAHTMRLLGFGRGADVKSAKSRFSAGDVLYGKLRPYLNKVALPDFGGICSTDIIVFTESPSVASDYLAHFLNQLWVADQAHHLSNGVELPRVDWRSLSQFPIAYPPSKAQQRAIVEQIETARSRRSSAGDHLRTAQHAIERFRQAVLAAACSGRLTAEWRESHLPGQSAALLATQIEETRRARIGGRLSTAATPSTDSLLPEGWIWSTIGTLIDVGTGATPLRRRSDYYGGSIPWVTSGAVNSGLILSSPEFITELAIKETNAKIFPAGTLVVAMYGEGQTRGRVAELGIAAATNQALAALQFDEQSERLRPYLRLFLLENYERLRQLSFGGVQPNLSLSVIRDMPLPLPPLDEQVEVVRRVDQLLKLAEGLQRRIETAAARVNLSSQAVLAKAFRGQLSSAATQSMEDQ